MNDVSRPMTEEEKNERIRAEIEHRFRYHPPKADQPAKYELIRDGAKELAYKIVALAPDGRERALALTKLDEVVFWSNAAIARAKSDV